MGVVLKKVSIPIWIIIIQMNGWTLRCCVGLEVRCERFCNVLNPPVSLTGAQLLITIYITGTLHKHAQHKPPPVRLDWVIAAASTACMCVFVRPSAASTVPSAQIQQDRVKSSTKGHSSLYNLSLILLTQIFVVMSAWPTIQMFIILVSLEEPLEDHPAPILRERCLWECEVLRALMCSPVKKAHDRYKRT